jgi:DNA-binding transcriptional regulator YdaS (Cro superfamily)
MATIHDLIDHFGGTEQSLATALKVSQPTVHAWKTGKHGMSALKALEVERLTDGKFCAADFCPGLAEYKASA